MAKPIRDFTKTQEVKGAAPRAYSTHPKPGSGGAQKARGGGGTMKTKLGKIPNK
jgi:hypothetical protein